MKLLVVSHACVTAINQAFFEDVSKTTGWEVSMLVPETWSTAYGSGMGAERLASFSGSMHIIPVWKPGNIPLHAYKSTLVSLLKEAKPDAIYVHHEPYGLATFQVYLANRLSIRRPIGFYAAQNIRKDYPMPFRWTEQSIFSQSNFAFPVSQGALDVLRQKGYRGAAEVLPLAVDLAVYRRRPEWSAAKRQELGIAPDAFVIGYVGRLVEEKGLGTLLRALARLRLSAWRCVLVGSGPYETTLRALAAELKIEDRVLFAGYVQHLEAPNWFSLFDLFVLPSESRSNWKEQFGRVIVEANACETAVVGTESGEIGNVLRSTGGGLIVPEADEKTLAEAMLSLINDREQLRRLAHAGAQAVLEKFDQKHLALQFARSIEQACDADKDNL